MTISKRVNGKILSWAFVAIRADGWLVHREKDSSLVDFEARYGRAIERIALLEQELVNKAVLEEQIQRLREEFRGERIHCAELPYL